MMLPRFLGRFITLLGPIACLMLPISGFAQGKVAVLFNDANAYWDLAITRLEAKAKGSSLEVAAWKLREDASASARARAHKGVFEESGAEVLVLNPSAALLFKADVIAAIKKGVKVVVMDGAAPAGVDHIQVGGDTAGLADAGAWLFSPVVTDGGEFAILGVAGSDQEKKALEVMQYTHPKAIVHQIVPKPGESEQSVANRLLAQAPKVVAVYATTKAYTDAMLQGLKEKKLLGKVRLIGCGMMLPREVERAIARNHMEGWVAQQPIETCDKAIDVARDLIRGKQVASPVATPAYLTITKANIDEVRIQALLD